MDDYKNKDENVLKHYKINLKKMFYNKEKLKNNNIKILIRKNKSNSSLNLKNPNFSFKASKKTQKNIEISKKMPKIKISSILKKHSQKYFKNFDLVKEFNKEFKNNNFH